MTMLDSIVVIELDRQRSRDRVAVAVVCFTRDRAAVAGQKDATPPKAT